MIQRAEVISYQEIMRLYNSGDTEELQRYNTLYAKRANQRMVELEKHGFDSTAAYKRATDWLKEKSKFSAGQRFSRSKDMSAEDLKDQLVQEANFLRAQTSTRKGELERREHIFESLTTSNDKRGPVIEVPSGMDRDAFKQKFLDFLDDNAWDELKKHIYSQDILNEAGEAMAAGASIDDLTTALEEYKNGETNLDLLEIWENWTKIE